jgi:uncharacterized protein
MEDRVVLPHKCDVPVALGTPHLCGRKDLSRANRTDQKNPLTSIIGVVDVGPMTPTLASGKICYVELPANDIHRSAEFYEKVFGWRIRQRGDGSTAFDDTTGQVSGAWVRDRPPAAAPGLLVYIMVDSVAAKIEAAVAQGGELVQPIGVDAPEITARFRDPAGNVLGLYQEPNRP